ncbi:hypothetical protein ACFS5M_08875 [Lacinutrix iliipiscaria]|uniref:Uncharacterized protein n=1 Tax=Lacinutrix iliipiscaria TaxID=1230532 RepID=A0ABW5WR98_9FLAO
MNNPFKQLNKPLQPVPDELKAKVMSDIATAKLLMELAELFSLDAAKVVKTVIDKRTKTKK